MHVQYGDCFFFFFCWCAFSNIALRIEYFSTTDTYAFESIGQITRISHSIEYSKSKQYKTRRYLPIFRGHVPLNGRIVEPNTYFKSIYFSLFFCPPPLTTQAVDNFFRPFFLKMMDTGSDSNTYWVAPSLSRICAGLTTCAHTRQNNSRLEIIQSPIQIRIGFHCNARARLLVYKNKVRLKQNSHGM